MSLRFLLVPLLALCVFAAGQAAAAPWLRIETDHFVLRGDLSEWTMREHAAKLVAFDTTLRTIYPHVATGRAPRKLDVYLVRRQSDLRLIAPGLPMDFAGFYAAAPIEPFLVANVGLDDGTRDGRLAELVLFHEYAHHFMHAYMPGVAPTWLSEGWADYFGATEIKKNNATIGGIARGGSLFSVWLPMEEVFTKSTDQFPRDQIDRFYAQSWIFVHYMMATPERAQQFGQILDAIGDGKPSVAAITAATGMDIATLTRQLKAYRRLTTVTFDLPQDMPRTFAVTKEPAASEEMQLDWLRAARGCGGRDPDFVAQVRAKADRRPDDPYAQRILAQAEFACGDDDAGEALVEKILARSPNDVATLQVGALGLTSAAFGNAPRRTELFQKARALAARAYALDPKSPAAIYAYVLARRIQPGYPTANDVASIRTAMTLSPSVDQIALLGGEVLMRSGQRDEGRALLLDVANNPHGGPMAAFARRLLARNDNDVGEALAKPVGETQEPAN